MGHNTETAFKSSEIPNSTDILKWERGNMVAFSLRWPLFFTIRMIIFYGFTFLCGRKKNLSGIFFVHFLYISVSFYFKAW